MRMGMLERTHLSHKHAKAYRPQCVKWWGLINSLCSINSIGRTREEQRIRMAALIMIHQRDQHSREGGKCEKKTWEHRTMHFNSCLSQRYKMRDIVWLQKLQNTRLKWNTAKMVLRQLDGGRSDLPNQSHGAHALLLAGFYPQIHRLYHSTTVISYILAFFPL